MCISIKVWFKLFISIENTNFNINKQNILNYTNILLQIEYIFINKKINKYVDKYIFFVDNIWKI